MLYEIVQKSQYIWATFITNNIQESPNLVTLLSAPIR